MRIPRPQTIIRGAAPAVATGALTVAHSLRARGVRSTLLFAGLGLGLPALAEYQAINGARTLRHHTHPQVKGVPVGAVLSWYNIAYATFTLVESIWTRRGGSERARLWALPAGSAVVATSLDLVLDCFGLDQGLWEWRRGGPYASEIVGPNGQRGIPVSNFVGWVGLTGGVTTLYLLLSGTVPVAGAPAAATRRGTVTTAERGTVTMTGRATAGRTAALLLLPYYLPAAGWALWQGKTRYLLYSILCPLALGAALTEQDPRVPGRDGSARRGWRRSDRAAHEYMGGLARHPS